MSAPLAPIDLRLFRHVCDVCKGKRQRRFEIADPSIYLAGTRTCSHCESQASMECREAEERAAVAFLDLSPEDEGIDDAEFSAIMHVCICRPDAEFPCSYCEAQ